MIFKIHFLTGQSEIAYVIPIIFLNDSLGTPLLPKTIEKQDFEFALNSADNKELLQKWYKLDSHAQPPCYRLQPIGSHIPGKIFKILPSADISISFFAFTHMASGQVDLLVKYFKLRK